jgi:flagellar hook-basal body complex protein FliE
VPADEVTRGTEVDESRVRTGPRHAAPRKPLFTRFHVPAGKAVAIAAMPTAVLMGMGFTPTLARADDHSPAKSLTADEYQKCVEAVNGKDTSASPTPSASSSSSSSASASASADKPDPTPSASTSSSPDKTSSSDSGSDDKAGSTPTPSASKSAQSSGGGSASTATPSASASSGGDLLGTIGDAITGIFTGGSDSTASSTASPTPSASASASASATKDTGDKTTSDTLKDTTGKVADTVKNTVKDTTDTATKAAEDTTKAVKDATDAVTSPSPSASSTTNAADCPVATDAEGGVDNPVTLPDDPWYLNASSLLLKGADYQGIVKVKTANGTVKKVLKYVISDGTDIGDLHQTVNDKESGKTYHVQAGSGTTSTIRDGKTVMYTESISGNLLGLIPITFSPDNPPPLNIPLIYFTKVKVVQAGQFGGTLTIPGLHQYVTG